MQDYSSVLSGIRGTILRCLDETEYDSLDTSVSTEGESTPTPSPGLPMSYQEFEGMLVELIDNERWGPAISHVKQYKQLSTCSGNNVSPTAGAVATGMAGATATATVSISVSNFGLPESKTDDIPTMITKIYSQRLTSNRSGRLSHGFSMSSNCRKCLNMKFKQISTI